MPTIREVAKKANVSYATVSHVINNTRYVSPETRERVLAAMAEMEYRPNAVAQSLRSGRTNTIGLILPDSSNPFFAEIGHHIEEQAFRLDYSVILCNMELNPSKESLYVDVLLKKQVDGIIFVATGDQLDMLALLHNRGIPIVVIDRDLPDIPVDTITADNEQGGYLATRHLIDLGHRRIACITGPSTNITPSARRVCGYKRALQEAGLPYDESLVCLGDFHPASGHAITAELLSMSIPPTAIFACNDLMALGAIRAAEEANIRIPGDVSIVGFDDIELARFFNPPLTTIAQPKVEIGVRATESLARRISDKDLCCQKIQLPTSLIVRNSSLSLI